MDSTKDKHLNIPTHVAIIPDGNRRWAKEKGLPTLMGHKKGAENFEQLLKTAKEFNIKYLTSWIFSTENWSRDQKEVDYLFDIARDFIKNQKDKFIKEQIRFIHLGRKDRLPKDIIEALTDLEEETKEFNECTFSLGMDYGGHNELVRAIQKLNREGIEITEENIEKNLDTKDIPHPDLIIRTSGEQRLSGFLSWQSAYAELYFPKVHYPDFNREEFIKAIEEYSNRNRRFGGN